MTTGGEIMTALVFPGQGAQTADMLFELAKRPTFASKYAAIRDATATEGRECWPAEPAGLTPVALKDNATSSLLAVLAAAVWLDAWRAVGGREDFYAGYSVGQWTALYAAGALDFEQTIAVVKRRAELMDRAQAEAPGTMLAVIGLPEPALRGWLKDFNAAGGHDLAISNFNSLGQYSLAGSVTAVEEAVARLGGLAGVKKVVRLPVAGAWHCARLQSAAGPWAEYLSGVDLKATARPVWDNVTGEPLPEEPAERKRQLVRQMTEPVRWSDGIKALAACGVRRFVEVGQGDMLTKFGVFVERGCAHEALGVARRAG